LRIQLATQSEGEYYLVSKQWMQQWKKYVHFYD